MKILAFSDVHGSEKALKRIKQKLAHEKIDLLICAGDITIFEQGYVGIVRKLDEFGIKTLIIHGNHESRETMKRLAENSKNLIFIHKDPVRIGDYVFYGYGGGGFSFREPDFVKDSKKFLSFVKRGDKIVLVTHAPPYNTKLDMLWEDHHCGNKDIKTFIDKVNPVLAVSGHIHENAYVTYHHKKTILLNPGPTGTVVKI